MKDTAIISIAELRGYNFLVEDYQRGFKWTNIEVEQLLNDINDFDEYGFYCLQPIVIKRIVKNDQEQMELIDGQQRLTTIYIIFSFLKQENKPYNIEYKTRESSAMFLNEIRTNVENKDWKDIKNSEKDNIDNYHFFQAYKTIKSWFGEKKIEYNSYLTKLQNKVKVIWYEVPQNIPNSKQESIKIFTRINSWKIPLTNAELIKALFLINIEEGKNAEVLKLKQNEISQQWDTIEYTLQDNAFWYFLSNDNPSATRIDFIFDLISRKPKDTEEKLYTFLEYNKIFSAEPNKNQWVETEWEKVKSTFQRLHDWFKDREIYHLVGFLICSSLSNIPELYEIFKSNPKTKLELISHLKNVIRNRVEKYDLTALNFLIKDNHDKINIVLLLYNIQTELSNKESNSRYQFDRHKLQKWSLEHIHAQKQDSLNSDEGIKKYVEEFLEYLKVYEEFECQNSENTKRDFKIKNQELINMLSVEGVKINFDKLRNLFELFVQNAKEQFPELFDLDLLSNMALLSGSINSSIGKDFFNGKRTKIIAFDKKGNFIPICTRNVFLKYYSENSTANLFYWSSLDRENYLENIRCTLKDYIKYTCKEKTN